MIAWTDVLEAYNQGSLGPGDCSGGPASAPAETAPAPSEPETLLL